MGWVTGAAGPEGSEEGHVNSERGGKERGDKRMGIEESKGMQRGEERTTAARNRTMVMVFLRKEGWTLRTGSRSFYFGETIAILNRKEQQAA